VIRSFRHKGLELYYRTGGTKGIQAKHAKRLNLILTLLGAASKLEQMNVPGLRLHPLHGKLGDFWSVSVSGNWRVIFRFDGGHAVEVDYVDYH
jgi:proteic killer suppression protein